MVMPEEKKSTPADVGSAKALPGSAKAGHSKSKRSDEKTVLPLVSRILDSLPSNGDPLAKYLSDKFVIVPHTTRPTEEELYCVTGPELAAHRYAAVHRAESGPKKQYDAFYWDPVVGMFETISATSNKHMKGREPCLITLERDRILIVFEKLIRRQIPHETLQAFVAMYGRLPLITWRA
jgi:hypothetical protein